MDASVRNEIYELHARLCKALADPKRLLIINALRDAQKSVGELTTELELSQSNVSQHLAVLRERGVVSANRDGNNVFYSLKDARVVEALDLLRAVMASQLDRRSELRPIAAG
ncbi:MAG TPA: metalloregulator ArsR/SmtB family transcription factor [Actinomycetota bacterium]